MIKWKRWTASFVVTFFYDNYSGIYRFVVASCHSKWAHFQFNVQLEAKIDFSIVFFSSSWKFMFEIFIVEIFKNVSLSFLPYRASSQFLIAFVQLDYTRSFLLLYFSILSFLNDWNLPIERSAKTFLSPTAMFVRIHKQLIMNYVAYTASLSRENCSDENINRIQY